MYRHLFFDLDHTLWDFETNSKATLKELFVRHRLDKRLTEDFDAFYKSYSYHNKRLWDRYHHGFIKQSELRWKRMWHTLLDFKEGSETLAKQLSLDYLEVLPTKNVLFPYAREIMQYLQNKGYVLHLITNGFEEVQLNKLRSCNIHHHFTHIVTSERANALKPHAAIFEYALQLADASKSESIMIGDNPDADIVGANNAGLDSIYVNHTNEAITVTPTYTVYHLKEIENIL